MNKHRIFIIDDDISLCNAYKSYLEKDYEIDICNDICDAELLIKDKGTDYWDVFICDLKVPYNRSVECKNEKFNTFDLIDEYIEPHKTIVITGYMSPEIKDMILSMDIFAIIEKPADIKYLKILINSILKCYGK
jgi:DNA-binding NtrC family response regulator